jgi:hypothetical protein
MVRRDEAMLDVELFARLRISSRESANSAAGVTAISLRCRIARATKIAIANAAQVSNIKNFFIGEATVAPWVPGR